MFIDTNAAINRGDLGVFVTGFLELLINKEERQHRYKLNLDIFRTEG